VEIVKPGATVVTIVTAEKMTETIVTVAAVTDERKTDWSGLWTVNVIPVTNTIEKTDTIVTEETIDEDQARTMMTRRVETIVTVTVAAVTTDIAAVAATLIEAAPTTTVATGKLVRGFLTFKCILMAGIMLMKSLGVKSCWEEISQTHQIRLNQLARPELPKQRNLLLCPS